MEYTITLAKTEDLPDIVEIYNSTIEARQSTADLSPVGIETRKPWFEAHSGKRPLYVLKNHSGELLAWGSFSDYYPRPAFHISAEISIYVRHNMRGVGVGKILLRNMLERAPPWVLKNVFGRDFRTQPPQPASFPLVRFSRMGQIARSVRFGNI